MIATNHLIKKLLFTLFAVFISNSTVAEWDYVGETEKATLFIEYDTIRKKGNMAKMWIMFDYRHEQSPPGLNFLSRRSQVEFDCDEEMIRNLYSSIHSGSMGGGQVLHYGNNPSPEWEPIPPETVGKTLREFACGNPVVTQLTINALARKKATALLPKAPDWESPNWKFYDVKGYKPHFYYDPTTIQKKDHFRKVWSRNSSDSYWDQRTLYEFDCQKERVKILHYDTEPTALNRTDYDIHIPPLRPGSERMEWVSLRSGLPDSPWYPSDDVKTLFYIICDK